MARARIGSNVEGLHAVRAAARRGRIIHLFVLPQVARRYADLVEEVSAAGGEVHVVDDLAGRAETFAPQGVVAVARPLPTYELGELAATSERPAIVVLDRLEDPHNVGAIARTAAAASMTGMVVASRRAAPLGATAFKAAAGALETLPVAVVSSIADSVSRLRDLGLWTVGLAADATRSLLGMQLLAEPVAIVVGGEGRGLSRLVSERVDVLASIPMAPGTESLNASVAAALAMYEVGRVRWSSPTATEPRVVGD